MQHCLLRQKPVLSPIALTVLWSSSNISGAIQPSVPAAPDLRENDNLPAVNFLQSPKSEIMALTCPWASGPDINTLCGFTSLCTGKYVISKLDHNKNLFKVYGSSAMFFCQVFKERQLL